MKVRAEVVRDPQDRISEVPTEAGTCWAMSLSLCSVRTEEAAMLWVRHPYRPKRWMPRAPRQIPTLMRAGPEHPCQPLPWIPLGHLRSLTSPGHFCISEAAFARFLDSFSEENLACLRGGMSKRCVYHRIPMRLPGSRSRETFWHALSFLFPRAW